MHLSSRGDNIQPMERPQHGGEGHDVERIAHRGAKLEFVENTLPAFRRAFELGADGIELDVHATRDGVVVVHHDAEVRASGLRSRAIIELTWDELQRFELAAGVGVPQLHDVLAAVPSGRVAYVEIKGSNIEALVANVLAAHPVDCAVHSFDHEAIARMRTIAPNVPRGILFDRRPGDVAGAIRAAGARDVWPERSMIDAPLVSAVHAAGARVIAWTVNTAAEARRLADVHVDGLCGDDVRLLDGP